MSTRTAVAALITLCAVAACKKNVERADTTTIPGVDTTKGVAMPTTDTVIKTTTSDTIRGEVPRDSVKAGAKTKTKTGTKTKSKG